MTRIIPALLLAFAVLAAAPPSRRAEAQTEPIPVDPSELERRQDLVDKLVLVDDRAQFYNFHQGKGYDELKLARTSVSFRLPPRLRPQNSPAPTPVVVQGWLRREGDQLVCDVTALRTFPSDLKRLEQAIAALTPRDYENRKGWAAWAERRGREFKDQALIRRAREIQAEALEIESSQRRKTVDAPGDWLAMAEDARRRNVPEPGPSALAHRAFRARLASADQVADLRELTAAIERFFPEAAKDQAAGGTNLAKWDQPYANDPERAYKLAPEEARRALDRRLWADAREKLMRTQVAADPASASRLAAEAEAELPERRELAADLLAGGLDLARRDLAALRLDDVKSMGRVYREKLGKPALELGLYRDWLKLQKERLSPTDAEGPVHLASLYEQLLHDRTTAVDLLRRAWKIDPGSQSIAEAFRTRGFRRVKDDWVEAIPAAPAPGAAAATGPDAQAGAASGSRPEGLRGKTREEVAQVLQSKPDRKVLTGVKGQLIEQWIVSVPSQRRLRYINFLHSPDSLQPRVIADYFLPLPSNWDPAAAH